MTDADRELMRLRSRLRAYARNKKHGKVGLGEFDRGMVCAWDVIADEITRRLRRLCARRSK